MNLKVKIEMILEIYYKIWVDGITKLRSVPGNKGMWKFYSMVFMSMAMAIMFAFLMAIFQRNILGYSFYFINIDIFPGENLDAFVSGFIRFVLPFLALNYFLIFYKKRYEKLIVRYKAYDGKLFLSYFLASIFIPLVVLWIGIILR
jgi:hypothetical protein